MTFWDYLSSDENRDVPSEAILNVLRRHDGPVLGTSDIADEIEMSGTGTKNRLEELEDEGRVVSQRVGNNLVWGLHPDERQKPVEPRIDRLVRSFDEIRETFKVTRFLGIAILLTGFALMFLGLTADVTATSLAVISPSKLVAYGYAVAAAGGAAWAIGGAITYGTSIAEHIATWRIKKLETEEAPDNRSVESTETESSTESARGQATPRFLLVWFVLIIMAKPVIRVGIEIYQQFVSLPSFSPFLAFAIATLLVVSIVMPVLAMAADNRP